MTEYCSYVIENCRLTLIIDMTLASVTSMVTGSPPVTMVTGSLPDLCDNVVSRFR